MAYTDTRLKEHVMLPNEAAYNTLKTTGEYTQDGVTIQYDPHTIYMTPTSGVGGGGLDANTAVITNAAGDLINSGVTSTELGFVANARSNIQKQIDDLKAQIGTGTGNYFADTFDDIDYDKPGNWYIPNGDGTYFHGVVDDQGRFRAVQARVTPEEIGAQDLSAYQKKADSSITVRNTSGIQQGTVVGALNALEGKTGNAWPLLTVSQDLSAAVNELAMRGGGTGGDVTVIAANAGVNVTNPTTGTFAIGHSTSGTAAMNYGALVDSGHVRLPLPVTDAYGHVTLATTIKDFYIPSTIGVHGQVWTYDAVNSRGYWATPTGGGESGNYVATDGITIDGNVIKHTTSGRGAQIGDYSTALEITSDQQGHVASMRATTGMTSQYMDGALKWHTPKSTAEQILSGSGNTDLVNASAIYDIMGGLRIVKLSQAQYDSLMSKDPNTLYVIVG